jgi:hypothetical protein
VNVPTGAAPGQKIPVLPPDGSSEIEAEVGACYYTEDSCSRYNIKQGSMTEHDNKVGQPMGDYSNVSPLAPPQHTALSEASFKSTHIEQEGSTKNGKQLVKVKVPPNAQAGSVIHVQVPDENRIIEAQIPPNCSQFYVQYEPKQFKLGYTQYYRTTNATANFFGDSHVQKLLLVQVPPYAAAGTSLHIEIPDEPGRVLSARVPPGVGQFCVSYIPNGPMGHHHSFK